MGALFGTDGVRGLANIELTSDLTLSLARAAAVLWADNGRPPRVLIGKDTRASGDMFEAAVVAGLCAGGANPVLGGVLPTPALAQLVPTLGYDAGVMITASHNPAEYNGLKFLDHRGDKIPEATEAAIEEIVSRNGHAPCALRLGRYQRDGQVGEHYRRRLLDGGAASLGGLRLVVDCAHGAMCELAPQTLVELGADVSAINCDPDGMNINVGGAVAPAQMVAAVRQHRADAGLALDGDGDRVVLADETGALVDGDQMLAIWASNLAAQGELPADTVVGTVLTNSGLAAFLAARGITLVRVAVGDRNVCAEMRRRGAVLGGETCGHIIYSPYLSSSDGLFTAISLLNIVARRAVPLSRLAGSMQKRPQLSTSLRVSQQPGLLDHSHVRATINQVADAFGARGRVVVRPSGTEPVIRITCECENEAEARAGVQLIQAAIEHSLGQEEPVGAHLAA